MPDFNVVTDSVAGMTPTPDAARRLKVVWVSHMGEGATGGAELAMLEAIVELRRRGVEIQAVLPARGEFAERLEAEGFEVRIVPFAWWVSRGRWRGLSYRCKRAGRNLFYARVLWRFLRTTRPDLVVSNTLTIPAGALAARCANIPHIWYVHELHGQQGHDLHFDLGAALSLKLLGGLSRRVIVNSRVVFDSLCGSIAADKLRLVYSAVEVPPTPAPLLPTETAELRLIQVGLLSPGKRQEDAVRALALLAAQGVRARLILLGGEALGYGDSLRQLARDLKVEGQIDFVPFSHTPFAHIAAANVALMCSRGEAFGRVTIEAMKLGKPVVGADSAGTAELVRDGVNGLLFRLGDPADLAAKLTTLYHDRALLWRLGRDARVWAEGAIGRERYVQTLLSIFDEVLAEDASATESAARRAARESGNAA